MDDQFSDRDSQLSTGYEPAAQSPVGILRWSGFVLGLVAVVAASGADMGCAASAGREHPVFGLWPMRLADDLRHALVGEGIRKVDVWTARYHLVRAEDECRASLLG